MEDVKRHRRSREDSYGLSRRRQDSSQGKSGVCIQEGVLLWSSIAIEWKMLAHPVAFLGESLWLSEIA